MRVYYGAGHEMFAPRDLLRHAQLAAEAGFGGIACSDHFQPWWEPGESGHAWPWLGAVGATTERASIGTAVTPCVARYHPALVAQAFATLEVLFPGRVFLGFGSGDDTRMNRYWPVATCWCCHRPVPARPRQSPHPSSRSTCRTPGCRRARSSCT